MRSKQERASRAASKRRQALRALGLDEEDYDMWVALQNGLCAICCEPETGGRRLAVDHCHKTGHVRGLLCRACNLGLGAFRDSTERLAVAMQYLGEAEDFAAEAKRHNACPKKHATVSERRWVPVK